MERLTFGGNFCDIAMCRENSCPYDGSCTQRKVWERLKEYEDAEQDGRLVALPCKFSDKLYVVGEKRIIRCDICEMYLDDKKGPECLVSFDCDNDCDGCPFNNWKQDYSGEWSCDGEYGQSVVFGSDFGKTVFLIREEAEAALKGEDYETYPV